MMNIESFKTMFRLIDFQKRVFLAKNWKTFSACKFKRPLSAAQVNHLMLIRFVRPCNLSKVMEITGLSSSGASLFVDNLVRAGIVYRETDPNDRRHIRIIATDEALHLIEQIDCGLNKFIDQHLESCTPEEMEIINKAGKIICDKLSSTISDKKI